MLKKSALKAFIGLIVFTIGCLELINADGEFINTEWKRLEQEQEGHHTCSAKKLADNSEEVTCKTEVLFRQKPPAEYTSKMRSVQDKLDQLESQFADCQQDNERKERLIHLQTNLTDTLHRILTDSDISALETSWSSLTAGANGRDTFGVDLVLWMLNNIPNMRDRFTKFNAHQSDALLKSDAEFVKQVNLIVGGLQSLISNLRNPGQLQASIERLADVHLHMKPSIGLEYFGPLQENIHSYIEKALGVAADSAAPKAWTHLLTAFNDVLNQYASHNIGLSDTDKVALESSWRKLTAGDNGKRNAGVQLVLWMFEEVPNMREKFSKFNAKQSDEALKRDSEFLKQVDAIMGGFETLINNLNDPVLLQDRLESLADAHLNKKPTIGFEYFGPLQKDIHQFIERELHVGSDSDEAKAWTNLIGALNKVIKDHAIHNLGLSDIDRESLVSSWRQLKSQAGGTRNAGVNFVLWLLEAIPNMRDRFVKFNARLSNDVLRNDPEFIKQVNLITGGLDSLINNINNPIYLHRAIVKLADAHLNLKPRVGLEYFGPLQRSIHEYIEKTLHVAADSAVSRAWGDLFSAFNNVLKDRTFLRILSKDDKEALTSSWGRLVSQAGDKRSAGTNLVLWMFDNVPNMRDRFSKFNAYSTNDALKADAEFLKQVDVIVRGVESMINNVGNDNQLQGGIENLVEAHLHMTPSVGLAYFGPLQQKIGNYIQNALGVSADSAEARAWTDLFSSFNEFLSDHTITKIGLSATDRKVLENSWNRMIAGGKQKAGVSLVLWMFNNVPNMRDQFGKFDAHKADDVLSQDAEFLNQVDRIVGGLESMLNNLNKPAQLQSALEHLADDHLDKKPRIGLEFFGPLQKYIHLYIESTLNVATGSDESKAWTNLIGSLNKVIRDHAIERLGLSDNDRKALDSSWKRLRSGAGGRKRAAINLVFWMFEHVPNMRDQFKKFNAHEPKATLLRDAEFLKQVDRILGGLESLLNNLDDPVDLKAAIDKLADAHLAMTPTVGLDFFGPLQQHIHDFVEETLGLDANSDESKSWTHLFAAFNRVLKERTVLKIVSENERAALKSSWKSLTDAAGDKQSAGVKLVLWMLENVPNMRDRFNRFNAHQANDVLKADAEFVKQVSRIVGGLESMINNVDNAGQLQAAIDRLVDAHLHMTPSVGLEYFEPLQQNIKSYIQSALGVSADSDEANAWSHLLSAFNTVLKEHSLQKIGLSDTDRKSLTNSWKKLTDAAGGSENAGTKLVFWLFDNVPNMRDRFTRFNAHQSEDALKADSEFVKQVHVITVGIESLVNNVNNPAALQAAIEKLVDAHLNMQPSIGLGYFKAVQQHIHLYIAKELNVAADSEEATAWTDLWAAFNKVLKEHSLEKIGITDNDRKALVSSWKRLITEHGGKQNLGLDLVLWMLETIPNMRDQFTRFDAHQANDALRRDSEFVRQVGRIVGGLDSLIDSVNDPGKLQAAFEKLTEAHIHFVPSVGIEFFGPLKDRIHEFIEKELHVSADSDESKGWTHLISAFNKVLKDHTIQHIGLSESDRRALGSSWKRLTAGENGVKKAGVNLVLWMFNNVPNMRGKFTKFDGTKSDDALRADAEFLKQVDVIVGGLESFLVNIDDPIQLQSNMDRIAEAHLSMTPAIGVEYFKILAHKIHAFIEDALGVSADSDESQAWTHLLVAFNKIVRNRTVLRIVSDSDKAALTSSWGRLVAHDGSKRNAGVNLVLWMFRKVPNMRNKFTKFNANQADDVLRGNAEFLKQVDKIVGGIESMINNVNNPSRLLAALERLSDVHLHMKPSVGLEFFGPLEQEIHSYIESTLNVAADSTEANAWTDLFKAFNKILKYSSLEKIGLTDSDKQALVSSWGTLTAGGKENAGVELVLWMFRNVPNMRDRFTKFNAHSSDDSLRGNAEFIKQVNVIVGGLDSLINAVNEPGQLQANLERLVDAHLHMTPSVGLEYFEPLKQYIHLYIEKALGLSYSSVESKAWTNLLGAFNKVLREHSIKKIGLSDTDRKAIVSSWSKLVAKAGSRQNAGINLVTWMFKHVPNMRDRFTKFNAYQSDAALRNDVEFLKQVDRILGGLESLINNVNNPGQFQSALERLSAIHKNKSPSIGLEYFGPLQRYIHLYIEQNLDVYADSDEAIAWSDMLASFNEVLKKI